MQGGITVKKKLQFLLAVVAMALFACACTPDKISSAIKDNTNKLPTPDGIYLDDDNVLRWNSVPNASSYVISIAGKEYERAVIACDLKTILKVNGSYEVFVKAKSNVLNIQDSDYSEGVTVKFTGGKDSSDEQYTETKIFKDFEDVYTKEAYIGYGYDVIGSSYVNSREVKMNYPIFDIDKLMNQRLMMIRERDSQDEYISGNSMESYQAEFEAKLKTKLKISKAFSASLNVKYKTTSSSTASALFYEYRHSTIAYSLVLQCDFEEYKNMLTDSFKRDLMNLDLPTLFSRYGTHLITSTIMGGRFDLNYTMLSNENIDTSKLSADLDTTLKAWCVDASVSASVDIEEKAKQNKCDITTYSSVFGGDYIAMQNEKAILSNYQKWLSTIEQKPALIGIRDVNSLVPVWELLGDSAEEQDRKAQMQDYFAKYGQETYDALLESYDITPPIHPTGLTVMLIDEKKNQLANNTTYAGAKIYLDLAVEPENAPITKSVTFSESDYVIYNSADNSVLIKDDVPNNTTIYITVDIGGGIKQTVAVKVLQTYQVTFRANGGVTASGNALQPVTVKHGDAVPVPEKITKAGYVFVGWYTDKDLTEAYYFGETPVTGDLILYAKWVEDVVPTYTITYIRNGGNFIENGLYPTEYTTESVLQISDLVYPTYPEFNSFDGWYENDSFTKPFVNDLTKNPRNVILYAKWNLADSIYTEMSKNINLNQGRVIVDWSGYLDGEYDFLKESGRSDNDLTINSAIKEVYFIGNPNAKYKNVHLSLNYSDAGNTPKIYFKDFNIKNSSVRATGQANKNVVFEFIGTSSIYAPGKSVAISDFDDIKLNGDKNSSIIIRGGDGANGKNGTDGKDKGTAASGKNGTDGNNGTAGTGGENGGAAIECKTITINVLMNGSLNIIGGNGGKGGNGGSGGVGEKGGYVGVGGPGGNSKPGGKGGNGAKGSNGGNGGNAITSDTCHVSAGCVTLQGGNGGNGGAGGEGGNGGEGGTNNWAFSKGGKGGTGGNGGNGGNGGSCGKGSVHAVTKDNDAYVENNDGEVGARGKGREKGYRGKGGPGPSGSGPDGTDGSRGADGTGK